MRQLFRNLVFLMRVDLESVFNLFMGRDQAVEELLEMHWHQIRILNGERSGEFLKRRPGGNDALTRALNIQPLPLAIAAEVETAMFPPVSKPKPARAKTRKLRKRSR